MSENLFKFSKALKWQQGEKKLVGKHTHNLQYMPLSSSRYCRMLFLLYNQRKALRWFFPHAVLKMSLSLFLKHLPDN